MSTFQFTPPVPSSFARQYASLLEALMSSSAPRETNERTGVGVAFVPSGVTLTMRAGPGLPLVDVRRTRPRTAAAEVEWFVSGEVGLDRLHDQDVHIWDQFAMETDKSANASLTSWDKSRLIVSTAYGYRWRNAFGRDQLREAVDTLRADPTSRRVFVSGWDPGADGMMEPQLATPCPVGFTLSTSPCAGLPAGARELNSTLLIRSSDVFVGLPYDVMGHAMLMGLLAVELGLRMGWLTVSLAHPHLYDVHRGMAHTALTGPRAIPHVSVCGGVSLSGLQGRPGSLVDYYGSAFTTKWPAYDPKPEVVR